MGRSNGDIAVSLGVWNLFLLEPFPLGKGSRHPSSPSCPAQTDDVNLGFYYGADLPDPEGLLQGTGKLLRHVKIREPKAIRSRALRRLLEAASTHRMPAQPSE